MIAAAIIGAALAGFAVGRYGRRWLYVARCFRSMRRLGICFHYDGRGYRETIGSIDSEYCRNCGHCAGYHWLQWSRLASRMVSTTRVET